MAFFSAIYAVLFMVICAEAYNVAPLYSTSNINLPADFKLRIGTRGSPLALAQANLVKSLLEGKFPELKDKNAVQICTMMTKGDSILSQPLSEIGGKGLFTKELDDALLKGEVDICVHSMKDVPTWLPDDTVIPCMLQREQVADVFISNKYKTLSSLPNDCVIGTASLRRQCQILHMNPTWKVVNFRGNVQTRLKKLANGDVDATILALAGLHRLEMNDLVKNSEILKESQMLSAVGQGAIGIQCHAKNDLMRELLKPIDHLPTRLAVECERGFLARLGGNCKTPIAGHARIEGNRIHFSGMIAKPNGHDPLFVQYESSLDNPWYFGECASNHIIEKAGSKFREYQDAFGQI